MFGAVNLRSSEQLTTQFGWSGHCPLSILNGENWIEIDKPPETRTKRSKYFCTQKKYAGKSTWHWLTRLDVLAHQYGLVITQKSFALTSALSKKKKSVLWDSWKIFLQSFLLFTVHWRVLLTFVCVPSLLIVVAHSAGLDLRLVVYVFQNLYLEGTASVSVFAAAADGAVVW